MDRTPGGWPMETRAEPRILIIGQSAIARGRGAAMVKAIGARIAAEIDLAEAPSKLRDLAGVDCLYIELEQDAESALDLVLREAERLASEGRCTSVIALPETLIDTVAAQISHPDVQLLCAPDDVERAAALGLATLSRHGRVGEQTLEGEARRLQQLSEEMARIAKTLTRIFEEGPEGKNGVEDRVIRFRMDTTPIAITADQIRNIIRARRMRDRFFAQDLFADPAWDMLLDLMAARLECGDVAVSSLCIAAAVPPTTALRWIRTMTDAGLLGRESDINDGRRIFITLSHHAAEGLSEYFSAIRAAGLMTI